MQKTGLIPHKGVPGVPGVPPSTKPTDARKEGVFQVSHEVGKLEQYGIEDPVHGRTENQPESKESQPNHETQQEPTLQEMSDEIDDDMDVVKEEEIEPYQKPPIESWNPIVSVEDLFSDDMPSQLLVSHPPEQSPCYPIINCRPGEIPTDTVYYCKLHPDMIPSTFVTQIELHCIEKEPERHKAAILEKGKI